MADEERAKMKFILSGFKQEGGCRLFGFERVGENGERVEFTVAADLVLIRKYGISLQDLPLLCRELLKLCADSETARRVIFTEEHMGLHQAARVAEKQAATARKRRPSRPPAENAGNAWRLPGS